MANILVAEDDEGVRSFLLETLESAGHHVSAVADGTQALQALQGQRFDLVLTDLRMPGADGLAVTRAARALPAPPPVMLLTAHGAVASAVEAMRLGAFDYLEKPLAGPAALRARVREALESTRPHPANPATAADDATATPLSWGAPAMVPVLEALRRVAKTNAGVMLEGETGSGKEVFARALHQLSARAAAPFVAVNCAALSENLMESELFGHEKGAFTGAHAQRIGRLEQASGGTFFLDELGELAPALQAKLLRVIETRSFERLGGNKTQTVDVRWVTATHCDLRHMVQARRFREDLYHRLAVFPIAIPPLRQRREDIPPLAELLLGRIAASSHLPPAVLSPQAVAALQAAQWPGNVRELRNTLERALILADGAPIEPAHLNLMPGRPADSGHATASADLPATAPGGGASLEDIERQAIIEALQSEGGNRRATAQRLGIGLRTLYDKLKRYRL